jgi:nicotinate-nucleotide adenylyltransferase
MRVGILGGTFDPVHHGHLTMARVAMEAAGLEKVLMIPSALPPHKERPGLADGYQRFAMLALSLNGNENLALSEIELKRGGKSYTVDTLKQLRRERDNDDLFLIVGSDSYAELVTWRAYEQILSMAAVLVIPRTSETRGEFQQRLTPELSRTLKPESSPPAGRTQNLLPAAWWIASDPVLVSSTEIRRRLKKRESVKGLLPDPVASHIRRQGLYE